MSLNRNIDRQKIMNLLKNMTLFNPTTFGDKQFIFYLHSQCKQHSEGNINFFASSQTVMPFLR